MEHEPAKGAIPIGHCPQNARSAIRFRGIALQTDGPPQTGARKKGARLWGARDHRRGWGGGWGVSSADGNWYVACETLTEAYARTAGTAGGKHVR
jgi:hypothetical protein